MAGLSMNGVTVHVAATDDDGPGRRLPVAHGIAIADSGGTCFYFPRQLRFYSFSWPLTRWLARHIREYDVVHIHALFSYPTTVAAWLAVRAGVPYLLRPLGTLARWGLDTRRPLLKRWSLALIERRLLRRAAAVQATSEQEKTEILVACPQCHAVVIPNPVEMPAALVPRVRDPKPAVILFLSRIDPKKGLEILLRAFDSVAAISAGLRLVVAGDGASEYVASIHRLAAALAARDRIAFTGNVEAERKQALFAEADLFVLPSHSENFGVAVVEAMSNGVPVLISPHVGIHNEVEGAAAGRTVPCTVEAVAQAIGEMMDDPAGLVRMGENGRRLAMERYSPELVARLLIDEYEAVLRRKT
jgi:glycosyltransferase involved in cell wall biosynthesis